MLKISNTLFRKYILGDCTEEEKQFVEKWINSEEGTTSNFSDEEVLQMKSNTWTKLDKQYQFNVHKLDTSPNQYNKENSTSVSQTPKIISIYKKVLRYAAVFLLLVGLGISFHYITTDFGLNKINNTMDFADYNTISNTRGQRKKIALPDGTMVWLNHDTEIKIPEKFSDTSRIIQLNGHAHFDVARNPDKPFIIYTKDSKTQVLGTSFDVNTNNSKGITEVIVTSGKVAFSEIAKKKNKVMLTVNDRAVLQNGKVIETTIVDAKRLTAWKNNLLVFDYVTFEEIIKTIEPWYDVEIRVDDPTLLKEVFKFSYDNPSLETLMLRMGNVAHFKHSIKGREVTISKEQEK